jgi:membrane protein
VINPIIVIAYLLQYGLMTPFIILTNSQYPIALFTIILLGGAYICNKKIVDKFAFILIFVLSGFILIKGLLLPSITGEIISNEIIIGFFTIGVSGILIGRLIFNFNFFIKYLTPFAWLNFLMVFWTPLWNFDSINYMRFGYALLPTVLCLFLTYTTSRHKVINLFIIIVSIFEIVVFGARGATFCLGVFVILLMVVKKYHRFLVLICCFMILGGSTGFFQQILQNTYLYFGDSSYAIMKMIKFFEGDLESFSSGRLDVYRVALNSIAEYPIFGSPFSDVMIKTGFSYYHNFIFDIATTFGIPFLFCFCFFLLYSFLKMNSLCDRRYKLIYIMLFTLAFGRMFFSSVFWLRPEFWVFISFCGNSKVLLKNSLNCYGRFV